ncbi:hypothetical protein QRD02_05905 [Aequorivita sp. SDUM287046]|uniref:Phage P1-related protein n=1 Tax=Aequorivita aurantiaca TaxID=3053356 RepID=A0ABT8DKY9_9FLAO|nr:hypothetical protein [Aequorivita aurantiaca]MDN3723908.1 hypothetical protein [Aequorivita aurantiaca]
MSEVEELIFPDLEYFEDYNGNFQNYFQAVYKIFEKDFIKKNTHFQGVRVSAQKFPLVDGIHRTFYHITHEGEDEQNREPDFRRMERIRFPKFCIENCPHEHLLIWKNQRGRDTRILIFNESEGYLTVLTERKDYHLFWTAYYITSNRRKNNLIEEYEAYKKAKTA